MHSRAINNMAIANREARAMPRAPDHVAVELAFRQRPPEMRAGFRESIYLGATSD
jgi:hypothetical protein